MPMMVQHFDFVVYLYDYAFCGAHESATVVAVVIGLACLYRDHVVSLLLRLHLRQVLRQTARTGCAFFTDGVTTKYCADITIYLQADANFLSIVVVAVVAAAVVIVSFYLIALVFYTTCSFGVFVVTVTATITVILITLILLL